MSSKMNLQLAEYTAPKTVQFVAAGWLFRFYKFALLVLLIFKFPPFLIWRKKSKLYFTNLTNFPGNSVQFSKSEWTLDGLFSQLGSSLPCTRSALNGLWTWIRKCILLFWKMKKNPIGLIEFFFSFTCQMQLLARFFNL